jgi:hypothetical protein
MPSLIAVQRLGNSFVWGRESELSWKKIGRIFDPAVIADRGLTAALMPIAEVLDVAIGLVRVYYSPRDRQNRSQVDFFDFQISSPGLVAKESTTALMTGGKIGAFDDAGITLGSMVSVGERRLLYYTGWNLTVGVPFNNSIGVAEYADGFFHRLGDGPVMTRTLHEPYSCASPYVMYENGIFRMWYASMDKWENDPRESVPRHYYNIKYCESVDGITWSRYGQIAIDYEGPNEYAFGRPFVLKDRSGYRMWYSFRGDTYRIGYAESKDGVKWERRDNNAGIDASEFEWDSEMIEYPYIFDLGDERYMLYNGNGYGKTGIGLAIWTKRTC